MRQNPQNASMGGGRAVGGNKLSVSLALRVAVNRQLDREADNAHVYAALEQEGLVGNDTDNEQLSPQPCLFQGVCEEETKFSGEEMDGVGDTAQVRARPCVRPRSSRSSRLPVCAQASPTQRFAFDEEDG